MLMNFNGEWCEDKLAADEKPKKVYCYWVTGRGRPPYDMLRHDRAWPRTQDDSISCDSQLAHSEFHSVQLCSYSEPTVARWHSFGWRCSAHKPKPI